MIDFFEMIGTTLRSNSVLGSLWKIPNILRSGIKDQGGKDQRSKINEPAGRWEWR